ncbi:putative phage protein [Melissococcus plutonius]|uniref:head-tail connector protein n=1 Tax=Melissococcus plutonius TaxID=33970 RepID=UPI00065F39BF|nr:head-tail connector protein [Melissococcus plutonius]AIM25014.1 putative phage protein [Melissococcus plutonius S1]KMT23447.1 putative phage protein [Melissococcus plutonius]KMT25205.1 putative phage protein [Melissococcus plutonius]KMT26111.1 putative phage protein [Melissococcus plutonius]KMT26841.1 putative phage protein [Melissococcus plutonius]
MSEDKLLETLKLSLRIEIEDTTDDEILKRNLNAAINYMKQAIGEEDELMDGFYQLSNVRSLFETAVIALASTYYMYRVSVQISAVNQVDVISTSIIGQLRTIYLTERRKRLEKSESKSACISD